MYLATVLTVMIFEARTELLVEGLGFCALLRRIRVVENWVQVLDKLRGYRRVWMNRMHDGWFNMLLFILIFLLYFIIFFFDCVFRFLLNFLFDSVL